MLMWMMWMMWTAAMLAERRAVRSDSRQRLIVARRPRVARAMAQVVAREVRAVRQAAQQHLSRRSAGSFLDWIEDYYVTFRAEVGPLVRLPFAQLAVAVQADVEEELGDTVPAAVALDAWLVAWLAAFAGHHIYSSRGQLRQLVEPMIGTAVDPLEPVLERLRQWEERRPAKVAQTQTVAAANAAAVVTYRAAGIRRLRWRTVGKTCPYCNRLDGRVIAIDGEFFAKGDEFNPEGAPRPLRFKRALRHPPAHGGCDCVIRAA